MENRFDKSHDEVRCNLKIRGLAVEVIPLAEEETSLTVRKERIPKVREAEEDLLRKEKEK